jgi:hypothetical protein
MNLQKVFYNVLKFCQACQLLEYRRVDKASLFICNNLLKTKLSDHLYFSIKISGRHGSRGIRNTLQVMSIDRTSVTFSVCNRISFPFCHSTESITNGLCSENWEHVENYNNIILKDGHYRENNIEYKIGIVQVEERCPIYDSTEESRVERGHYDIEISDITFEALLTSIFMAIRQGCGCRRRRDDKVESNKKWSVFRID